MAEDNERGLSLGKKEPEEHQNSGFDVSPVINNIMGYMDESSGGTGLFSGLKKKPAPETDPFAPPRQTSAAEESPSAGGQEQAQEAPETQENEPEEADSSPIIGGGEFDRGAEENGYEAYETYEAPSAGQDEDHSEPENDFFFSGETEESRPVITKENKKAKQEKTEPEAPEQPEYHAAENNLGAAFTMRTLDDRDKSKAPSKQPEYIDPSERDRIARSIAKLRSSLSVRAVIMFFAAVFSIFITSANDLELPLAAVFDRTVNPSAYLFTNTILGILSVGFSYSMVINGIKNLVKLKPDSDSLAAVNILAAVIAGLATLFDPESLKAGYFHLYTSAAITGMFFNTLAKLSIASRAQRNFELLNGSEEIYAIQHEDEETTAYLTNNKAGSQGDIALMRKTGFVRDFMKNSYSFDLSDLFAEKTAPVIIGVAAAAAVLSVIFDNNPETIQDTIFTALAAFSGALSLCSSFALAAVVNIPLSSAGRKASALKGALLGYSSVEEFAGSGTVLIDAEQLFPGNSTHITNMKMLGSQQVDDSVLYAASLAAAGGFFTAHAFEKMLGSEADGMCAVKDISNEDGEGISGVIGGRRMLLGSRELMKRSNVSALPPIIAEENFAADGCVMYLSVSGTAAAMFCITPGSDKDTGDALKALQSENVEIYIRCPDGILTRDYAAFMYGIKPDKVHILRPRAEGDTGWLTAPAESLSASMFCTGGIPAFAQLIAEARRVKLAANLGIAIQYGQAILGGLLSVFMMLSGNFGLITPTVAMVYSAVFLALTLLIQKLRS